MLCCFLNIYISLPSTDLLLLVVQLIPPKNNWVQAFDPDTRHVYFYNIVTNETRHFNPNNPFVKVCCVVGKKSAEAGVIVGTKTVVVTGKVYTGTKNAARFGYHKTKQGYHKIRPPKEINGWTIARDDEGRKFFYRIDERSQHPQYTIPDEWVEFLKSTPEERRAAQAADKELPPPEMPADRPVGSPRRSGGRVLSPRAKHAGAAAPREREYHEDTMNPLFQFAGGGAPKPDGDPTEWLFAQIDLDGSGQIAYDEFSNWFDKNIPGHAEGAREIFEELDEDGTGLLDQFEFKMILTELAEADWVAATDPASGRPYYVNVKTRATRWVAPGDEEVNDWVAAMLHADGDTGGALAGAFATVSGAMSADTLFDAVDVDNSDEISFAELADWWEDRLRAVGKPDDGALQKIEDIFVELDEDESGTLDREEFKMILTDIVMDDWVAAKDAVSGRTYYVNKTTRETRWVPPGDADVDTWLDEELGGRATPAPAHVDRNVLTVDALFSAMDRDSSGQIIFAEFERFWRDRQRTIGLADDGSLATAKALFEDLDEDNSGSLDRVEFQHIMTELVSSDWTAARDPGSGREYYVNIKTRATRWVSPGDDDADEFVKQHFNGDGASVAGGGGASTAARTHRGSNISSAAASTISSPDGSVEDTTPAPAAEEESTIAELFLALDTTGDGMVAFAEFEEWWVSVNPDDTEPLAHATEIFMELDEDSSGTLDLEEFEHVLMELASKEWVSAVDSASGRTYYVNSITKATRWVEPGLEEAEEWLADRTGWVGDESESL